MTKFRACGGYRARDLESSWGWGEWGWGGMSCVPLRWGLRLSMFSQSSGVRCFFPYIPSQRSLSTISWVITDCNVHSTSSAESVTEGTQVLHKYTQTQQYQSEEDGRKPGRLPRAKRKERLCWQLSWPSIQPSWRGKHQGELHLSV